MKIIYRFILLFFVFLFLKICLTFWSPNVLHPWRQGRERSSGGLVLEMRCDASWEKLVGPGSHLWTRKSRGDGQLLPVSDPSNLVEAAYGCTFELWLHSLLIRTPSSMLLGVCPASAKAGKTWELFRGLLSFWSGRQSFWQEVGGKRERVAPRRSWFDPAFDPRTFDPATVMVKVATSVHMCIVKSQRSFERWRAWHPGAEETSLWVCRLSRSDFGGDSFTGGGALVPMTPHWWGLCHGAPPLLCEWDSLITFVVVQLLNHFWLSVTPWPAPRHASLSFTISLSFIKPTSIELGMPSNHFILCCPLLLLPSVFLSIRVFYSESDLWIRWPKYWSFSYSISPSNEYSRLISFKIDWFELLSVQGTLQSLLHHQSSKVSEKRIFKGHTPVSSAVGMYVWHWPLLTD